MPRPAHLAINSLTVLAGIAASWLGMMVIHECGHVLHAWLSGGAVERVVLHPLAFSRTDVSPNPHPQFVTWGGPAWGAVVPMTLLVALRRTWLCRPAACFAGFCLLANGLYIGAGVVAPVGDADDLLRRGAPAWTLGAFGAVTVAEGLFIWHRVPRRCRVDASIRRREPILVGGALATLVAGMVIWTAI